MTTKSSTGRGFKNSRRAALIARTSAPASYAGTIAATGTNEGYASPPVAPTAPIGVSKTAKALIVAG